MYRYVKSYDQVNGSLIVIWWGDFLSSLEAVFNLGTFS